MKILFIILLLPVFAYNQTIHFEGDKIEYKGIFDVSTSPAGNYQHLQLILSTLDIKDIKLYDIRSAEDGYTANVGIRLTSPYPIITQMNFKMELGADDGKYQYKLKDFFLLEKKRGGKKEKLSADDLLDKMEDGGILAGELERKLNEADMKVQQLLAVLKNLLQKTANDH